MAKNLIEIEIPEELNMDGLELRGNYRVIGYRQDILHAVKRNHAAAYVTTALLRWTRNKREDLVKTIKRLAEQKLSPLTKEDLEIWIHMSYEEFVDEFDGLFSHNTIKDAVTYLMEEDIIFQRKNHNPKFKDYEYRINLPVLRELLKNIPTNPLPRPRDNRNRKKRRSESPNLVTQKPTENSVSESPNLADVSPNLAVESPNLADVSPNLAEQYTVSHNVSTVSSQVVVVSDQNSTPENGTTTTTNDNNSSSFLPIREKGSLSPEEEQIYTRWSNLDAFLGLPDPIITKTVKGHCSTLFGYEHTSQKDMQDLYDWIKKNRRYVTIELGNMVHEYRNWRLAVQKNQPVQEIPQTAKQVEMSQETIDAIAAIRLELAQQKVGNYHA